MMTRPPALSWPILLSLVTALLLGIGGCAASTPSQLDALTEPDRAVVKVMAVRELYGSRVGRVKFSVFDYGDECPPERNRTSSASYRGSMSVRPADTNAQIPVSGGSATLIRVYDKQKTSRLGHVTCNVGFWFTPQARAEYVLQYSNVEGRCSVSLVDAGTMAVVPIHRPGTCSAELLAKQRERQNRAGELSLRSSQRTP